MRKYCRVEASPTSFVSEPFKLPAKRLSQYWARRSSADTTKVLLSGIPRVCDIYPESVASAYRYDNIIAQAGSALYSRYAVAAHYYHIFKVSIGRNNHIVANYAATKDSVAF